MPALTVDQYETNLLQSFLKEMDKEEIDKTDIIKDFRLTILSLLDELRIDNGVYDCGHSDYWGVRLEEHTVCRACVEKWVSSIYD